MKQAGVFMKHKHVKYRIKTEAVKDLAALYTKTGAIALHGIQRAKVQTGDTVAIIGQGLIGYLAAQAAKVHGVRVIAIDRLPEQLEMARKAGADFTLNPVEDPIRNRVRLSSRLGGESFRHKEVNQP